MSAPAGAGASREDASRVRARKGKVLVAGAVALAACLLLALAVPRSVAAVLALPGDPWLRLVQRGEPIGDRGHRILRKTRVAAASWSADPRLRTDRALADLAEALAEDGPRARREALIADADRALVEGLSGAPANPFAWARLAQARGLGGASGEALRPLFGMSLATGPAVRRLAVGRTVLGLTIWPALNEADRAGLRRQADLAWRDPDRRARLVERAEHAGLLPRLRLLLLPDIGRLVELEQALKRRAAQN